jgi:hypothetical protein
MKSYKGEAYDCGIFGENITVNIKTYPLAA